MPPMWTTRSKTLPSIPGEMRAWIVTLAWNGETDRLQPLLSALLHLQPSVVKGQSQLQLTIRAVSAPEAERYVRGILEREDFADDTSVISVEPAFCA